MSTLLTINNINKLYGKRNNVTKAINGLSFSVDEGDLVAVMGPSGSGKSTLLNIISSLDKPTSGSILFGDRLVSKIPKSQLSKFRRENIGFIFQDYKLISSLTVKENIAIALTINDFDYKLVDKSVESISKLLKIEDILYKYPGEISGGQKQRVATARALISKPSLILADEPTGALDSKSSLIFLNTIQSLNKELNTTMLMVTHDAFAASFCNRIIFIKDGRIFTEIYKGNDSSTEFFYKIMNVVSLLGGDASYDL